MSQKQVRRLPVVTDGRLVGVLAIERRDAGAGIGG
jgi:CBS domain-containing protein